MDFSLRAVRVSGFVSIFKIFRKLFPTKLLGYLGKLGVITQFWTFLAGENPQTLMALRLTVLEVQH